MLTDLVRLVSVQLAATGVVTTASRALSCSSTAPGHGGAVVDTLFGGATEHLEPASRVVVSHLHADGDSVIVEHVGRNVLPDGRRYDNQYCWVLRFQDGLVREVREYMDTQLVTGMFGADKDATS